MELKKAIEIAKRNKRIKRLLKNGYFLVSCFGMMKKEKLIEKWILHFCSPINKVVDVRVGDDVIISKEMSASKKLNKIDFTEVKKVITVEQVLKGIQEKLSSSVEIFFVLHKVNEKIVWAVNIISPSLNFDSIVIDAFTGKVISKKKGSLIKKKW